MHFVVRQMAIQDYSLVGSKSYNIQELHIPPWNYNLT